MLAFVATESGNGGARLWFAHGVNQASAVAVFHIQILARCALGRNDVGGTWFRHAIVRDLSALAHVLDHNLA